MKGVPQRDRCAGRAFAKCDQNLVVAAIAGDPLRKGPGIAPDSTPTATALGATKIDDNTHLQAFAAPLSCHKPVVEIGRPRGETVIRTTNCST